VDPFLGGRNHLQHSVRQLRPGQTLYLRGGTYFENVYCSLLGTAERQRARAKAA
jgi:hypothetical protein